MALRMGKFKLHQVRDGTFALDGGAMFGVVPKPFWQKRHPVDDRNRIELALRCLLIQEGNRRILVDAGIGPHWDEKRREIFAINPSDQGLDRELARAGCAREEITDLVLTQLQFDHGGGATRIHDGKRVLSFPRATYHLQRRNWNWAQHPSDNVASSFRAEDFDILASSGRLHLLDGQTELFPGIELSISEGHTVGMQLVRISSGDRGLVFCTDLIPTASHLRSSWMMAYHLHPQTVIEEKRKLLARALKEKWMLFFAHDPMVAACSIKEQDGQPAIDRVISF